MLNTQIELEKMYAKNHLVRRLDKHWEELTIAEQLRQMKPELDIDLALRMTTHVYLHKRVPIEVLVGILTTRWKIVTVLEHIEELLSIKLFELDDKDRIVNLIQATEEVERELNLFQYPLPMIVEPEKVTRNYETGYLTIKKNIILQMRDSEGDCCLDHINTMNSIPLTMDMELAKAIPLKWRNVDKPKKGESFADFQKRLKAFRKYVKDTKQVMETLDFLSGSFYMTHAYDKRGRVYCNGYHANYQGTDWNKAVVHFAEKELQ